MPKVKFEDIERDLTLARAEQTKAVQSRDNVEDKLAKVLAGTNLTDITIDVEDADFEAVRKNEKAFEANLATLIYGLDEVTKTFGAEFRDMSQSTTAEKVAGFFSRRKAAEMRSDRVRHTDIRGNLNQLIEKSNTISGILTQQLDVLDAKLEANTFAQQNVLGLSQTAAGEIGRLTDVLDGLAPRIASLDEQLAEASGEARKKLEAERIALSNLYNETQSQLQSKTAEQQSLEKYVSQYSNYIESLTRQRAAQQTMIAKLKIDTEQRTILYDTLAESLRTTQEQDIAHRIDEVGRETDAQAEELMLQGGVSAQNKIAGMMEAHAEYMKRSEAVAAKGRIAQDAFARRFSAIMQKVDAGHYTEATPEGA
jgi:hypothetical protein